MNWSSKLYADGAVVSHSAELVIRQAILLLVAHWYEHREPIQIGAAHASVPQMVSELLQPYRRVGL